MWALRRFPPKNRSVEADQGSSTHNLTGRDSESESVRLPEYSLTDTLGGVAAPNFSKRTK